jgi:predicted dehydrogenase
MASYGVHRYRRPALELYGSDGTANLLGDDWDPAGIEVFRASTGTWELTEPLDTTWLWTDGLRELVQAVQEGRAPLGPPELDLHLLDVVTAVSRASATRREQGVDSRPPLPDLTYEAPRGHAHDRTRPIEQQ